MTKTTDMKGKKILITGGLGFIGSNMARKCLEQGAQVTIFDCLDPHTGGNMHNIHDIKGSVQLILSDINKFEDVCNHIMGHDVLFNCAASTSHPHSMRDPNFDIDSNSKGVISLLEAARRFNRNIKFVQLGTTTQIGKLIYNPADEKHPEFPMDIYSANKSVSEKYVLIYGSAYAMPVTVVRISNVYGPRAAIHSKEFNFVSYFVGLALQDREITVYGEGKQMRNLLYIDDCVEALMTAAQSDKTNGEVLFAVGDQHYPLAHIAAKITEHLGGKVRHVDWPAEIKAIEVGDAVISNQKMKQLTSWRPRVDLDAGMTGTKDYFTSCLEHYIK